MKERTAYHISEKNLNSETDLVRKTVTGNVPERRSQTGSSSCKSPPTPRNATHDPLIPKGGRSTVVDYYEVEDSPAGAL